MSNELKDIAEKLHGYGFDGWEITQAAKHDDGSWTMTIQPMKDKPEADQEATNDNNK